MAVGARPAAPHPKHRPVEHARRRRRQHTVRGRCDDARLQEAPLDRVIVRPRDAANVAVTRRRTKLLPRGAVLLAADALRRHVAVVPTGDVLSLHVRHAPVDEDADKRAPRRADVVVAVRRRFLVRAVIVFVVFGAAALHHWRCPVIDENVQPHLDTAGGVEHLAVHGDDGNRLVLRQLGRGERRGPEQHRGGVLSGEARRPTLVRRRATRTPGEHHHRRSAAIASKRFQRVRHRGRDDFGWHGQWVRDGTTAFAVGRESQPLPTQGDHLRNGRRHEVPKRLVVPQDAGDGLDTAPVAAARVAIVLVVQPRPQDAPPLRRVPERDGGVEEAVIERAADEAAGLAVDVASLQRPRRCIRARG
mmetsp:Transcript_42030/g.129896  ORF Transcript_42030/g.129896 Transcript_42030/m.129896 type:complete len:361 (-) Transcript_42030:309-1391(-)